MTTEQQTDAKKPANGTPSAPPEDAELQLENKKQKKPRTRGLWLFDAVLYNFTNFAVFAISVVFTYLTQHGATRRASDGTILKTYETEKSADGKTDLRYITKDKDGGVAGTYKAEETKLVFGGFGRWMNQRGVKLSNIFQSWGMSKDAAEMSKMVFFSFADGTLVAPLVKLAEDRREKIAYWLDKKMGTVPEDMSVYDAEPKQSWGSVLAGRLATVSVVVPTAVLLEGIGTKSNGWKGKWTWNVDKKNNKDAKSLNDLMFNDPGEAIGSRIAENTQKARKYGVIDVPYLYKTFTFEAFYTTVCTVGLYYSSRFIARLTGKKDAPVTADVPHSAASKLTTVHSVTFSHTPLVEKKFSADTLKATAPGPAAEQFSERPLTPAEHSAFVSA